METLFQMTKITHSKRVFCSKDGCERKKVTISDLNGAFDKFKVKNKEAKKVSDRNDMLNQLNERMMMGGEDVRSKVVENERDVVSRNAMYM